MIANLNLATQPFSNRMLPWVVTAAIGCVALGALIFIFSEYRSAEVEARSFEPEVQRMRAELNTLRAQDSEVREALSVEQRQTLDAAHALVNRKRFSWSRLFSDLEASLPGEVRVTRIRVRDTVERRAQTYAELELSVVSQNPATVTNMVNEMNRAGIFAAQPLTEVPRTGRGESGAEWTLALSYLQRSGSRPVEETGELSESVRETFYASQLSGGER